MPAVPLARPPGAAVPMARPPGAVVPMARPPGAAVCERAQVPQRADTPTGDSGNRAPLRIFMSALVGGLAAAVVLSHRDSGIRG